MSEEQGTYLIYGIRMQYPNDNPVSPAAVVGVGPSGRNFLINYLPNGEMAEGVKDLGLPGLKFPDPWMSYTDKGGFEEVNVKGGPIPVTRNQLSNSIKLYDVIELYAEQQHR